MAPFLLYSWHARCPRGEVQEPLGAPGEAALITGVRELRWPLSNPGLEFPTSKLSQLPARGTFLLSSSTPVLSLRGSRGCPSEAGGACPSSTIPEVSPFDPRQLQRGQLLGCPEEWQLLPQPVQVANGGVSSCWSQKSSLLQMSSWLQKVSPCVSPGSASPRAAFARYACLELA